MDQLNFGLLEDNLIMGLDELISNHLGSSFGDTTTPGVMQRLVDLQQNYPDQRDLHEGSENAGASFTPYAVHGQTSTNLLISDLEEQSQNEKSLYEADNNPLELEKLDL